MRDTMRIKVLEDGTIRTETDPISPAVHASAEQFVRDLATLAGGDTTRKARHEHTHAHTHSHAEADHTH